MGKGVNRNAGGRVGCAPFRDEFDGCARSEARAHESHVEGEVACAAVWSDARQQYAGRTGANRVIARCRDKVAVNQNVISPGCSVRNQNLLAGGIGGDRLEIKVTARGRTPHLHVQFGYVSRTGVVHHHSQRAAVRDRNCEKLGVTIACKITSERRAERQIRLRGLHQLKRVGNAIGAARAMCCKRVSAGVRKCNQAGISHQIAEAAPTIWSSEIESDSRCGDVDQVKTYLLAGGGGEIPLVHAVRCFDAADGPLIQENRRNIRRNVPNRHLIISRAGSLIGGCADINAVSAVCGQSHIRQRDDLTGHIVAGAREQICRGVTQLYLCIVELR